MTPATPTLLLAACLSLSGAAAQPPAPPARSSHWILNETPSLPRGLYRRIGETPRVGATVALQPPTVGRAYLARIGAPADARLLKRVAALSGQTVCNDGVHMSWGDRAVRLYAHDRRGRHVPAWRGCRKLGGEDVLVLGDSVASFDSRYFGPVARRDIEGVYEEVLTW